MGVISQPLQFLISVCYNFVKGHLSRLQDAEIIKWNTFLKVARLKKKYKQTGMCWIYTHVMVSQEDRILQISNGSFL